jgi:hypothetical protein
MINYKHGGGFIDFQYFICYFSPCFRACLFEFLFERGVIVPAPNYCICLESYSTRNRSVALELRLDKYQFRLPIPAKTINVENLIWSEIKYFHKLPVRPELHSYFYTTPERLTDLLKTRGSRSDIIDSLNCLVVCFLKKTAKGVILL